MCRTRICGGVKVLVEVAAIMRGIAAT